MKKVTLLLILSIIFSLSIHAQKAFKYGHIDGNAVYRKMPEVQKADTVYSKYIKALEDQIKEMQDEYNKKAADYQQNETTMSDILKETKLDEIKSLGERIQKFQVSAQEDAGKKQKEMYDPAREKFNNALKSVAIKYGYKFIIDKSVLLYFDDIDDVTKLVETELGIK